MKIKRRYPIGAEIIPKKGVHFRVWAPKHKKVSLVLENEPTKPSLLLENEGNGYFSLLVKEASHGTQYRFQLGSSKKLLSDPASRFQPEGPFGPSCVVDPTYHWTDQHWPGITIENQIIYEMHIGTFTRSGTFIAAMDQLDELAALGITIIEVMPINEFPGRFGWGYDGVNLFAPTHLYGGPDDVKAFINKAHHLGLGVILDIVYNHLGPDGNQLFDFSDDYRHHEGVTDWGSTINFDVPPVREYFLTNARYWIEEYHFDGFRVDATSWLYSSTETHILADLTRTTKEAGGGKKTIVIGENEPQNTDLLRSYKQGGYGFDALWNDDFHHTAVVRLTGRRGAYYSDYLGSAQELISAVKYGFLYQGQYYEWQKQKRGILNLEMSYASMITFLENHDQVANTRHGKRLQQFTDFGNYKAMTCLLLLGPNTPMLFQGQEFGSSSPFLYFADHSRNLNRLIIKGRKKFLSQFLAMKQIQEKLPDPTDIQTFLASKLKLEERENNSHIYSLHRDLIKLRKTDPVFKEMQNLDIDGAVLGYDAFLLRYFGGSNGDRLILINFGRELFIRSYPEPLLAAAKGCEWALMWSSESPTYGGEGTPIFKSFSKSNAKISGHSAIILKSVELA